MCTKKCTFINYDTCKCVLMSVCVSANTQGLLITCCSNNTLYLWSLYQKEPSIKHSLELNRERYVGILLGHIGMNVTAGELIGNHYYAQ